MDRTKTDLWELFRDNPCEETFRPIYEETKGLVFTICYRILRNPEDAADAFQSVYCRALALAEEDLSELGGEDTKTVLGRLAFREANNLYKRRRRKECREVAMENIPESTDVTSAPDQIAAQREVREKIETLVATLPERYRLPLLLHYFHGMTRSEIARILNKPEGTVGSYIMRGIKKLRPLMQRAGLGESAAVLGAFVAVRMFDPPATLGAAAVFAHTKAVVAAGGSGVISADGLSNGGLSKALVGGSIMKAKIAVVGVVIALAVAGLVGPKVIEQWKDAGSQESLERDSHSGKGSLGQFNTPGGDDSTFAEQAKLAEANANEADILPSAAADDKAMEMLTTRSLAVQVVWKESGKSVSDVALTLRDSSRKGSASTATTEQSGKAFLVLPAGWKEAELTTSHPDAARMITACNLSSSSATVRIELERGATVFGKVYDGQTGLKIVGAEVWVSGTDLRVRTDKDGSYELSQVPRGDVCLAAAHPPLRSFVHESDIPPLSLKPGERRNLPLILELRPMLIGVVRDKETEEPIVGATVLRYPLIETLVTTDKDGRFQLGGLAPHEHTVRARSEEYVNNEVVILMPADQDKVHNFNLIPGGEVEVTVVDTEGRPIEGATISEKTDMFISDMVIPQTDASGKVVVKKIDRADPPPFSARKTGYTDPLRVTPFFATGQKRVELKFALKAKTIEPRAFAGRVTNESGDPIEGVKIVWGGGSPLRGSTAKTDVEGEYLLTTTEDNQFHRLSAALQGWAPQWDRHERPGLEDSPRHVDFVMEPAHWMTGLVVDTEGQPIPKLYVSTCSIEKDNTAFSEFSSRASTRTDAEGRFRLDDLPGPRVKLEVYNDGWTDVEKILPVDQDHTITMSPSEVIRGRVIDKETNQPVEAFNIKFIHGFNMPSTRSRQGESFSDKEGRFVLRDVLAGKKWGLIIQSKGYAPCILREIGTAPEDDAEEHLFHLVKPIALKGALVDATSGKPISEAKILHALYSTRFALDWGDLSESTGALKLLQWGKTSGDGTFSFSEGEQKGTLLIQAQGYPRKIFLPEERAGLTDATGKLTIPLLSGASVSGLCILKGKPVFGARLSISKLRDAGDYDLSAKPSLEPTQTNTEGCYRWDSLTPGRYEISLEGENSRDTILKRDFELAAGEEKIVNIGEGVGSYVFSGRVMKDGKPLNGASVGISPLFQWEYQGGGGATDGEGRFKVPYLRKGKYSGWVNRDIYGSGTAIRFEIEIKGDTEKDFHFQSPHRLTVKVTFPENSWKPDEGELYVDIMIADPKESWPQPEENVDVTMRALVDRDTNEAVIVGRFKGNYRISFHAYGKGAEGQVNIPTPHVFALNNLESDQDVGPIEVPLLGAIRFEIAIDGPETKFQPSLSTSLYGDDKDQFVASGGFSVKAGPKTLEGLPLGTYRAKFSVSGWKTVPSEIEKVTIGLGQQQVVSLRLTPYRNLSGKAHDATDRNKEVKIQTVTLIGHGEMRTVTAIDAWPEDPVAKSRVIQEGYAIESRFNFSDLKAGTYQVTVKAQGYETWQGNLAVEPGTFAQYPIPMRPLE